MRRIKLTIGYIGTAYSGWQRQPDQDTVQKRIEDAIYALTKERVSVQGSGRTDAGVHALGQVAHFDTDATIPLKNFVTGVNHFLPSDIRVENAEEVDESFHARFNATSKTYCYLLYESDREKAVYLNRAVQVKQKLSLKKMRDCAVAFLGEHDFTSFMSTGADTTGAVRTITELKVERADGLVRISVSANGFLYNMVRLIVGVLVRAGKGEIDCNGVKRLIELKSKDAVREVMPACGLYLKRVEY